VAAVLAADGEGATIRMVRRERVDKPGKPLEWVRPPFDDFARIDFAKKDVRFIKTPQRQWLGMQMWARADCVRRAYDAGPQLFIEDAKPDELIFFDVRTMKDVGRLKLPEAALLWGESEDPYERSSVSMSVYSDRYVVAYAPQAFTGEYRIMAIDRKTRKIIWSKKRPMAAKARKRFGIRLFSGGSSVWVADLDAKQRMTALSIDTGEKVGGAPDYWEIFAWYGLGLTPQEDFHNPRKHLTLPEYPWREVRGHYYGDVAWPGGPKIAVDKRSHALAVMGANPYKPKSPEVFWSLTAGPYTILCTDVFGGFLGKSATLLRAVGYKGEIPAEVDVDIPLMSDRADWDSDFFCMCERHRAERNR
jgi:hypothetical protein